jgi:transcriptional regulator GlxA family with amidase domain
LRALFFTNHHRKMRTLAIVLFNEVEVLDFAGPFEVFSVAGLRGPGAAPFKVFTVAEQAQISARNGLRILPDYTFDTCPSADMILVPGGGGYHPDGRPFGSRREMDNPVMLEWVQKMAASAEYVLSVCTGSMILANAGLLKGLKTTTHFKAIDSLRELAPTTEVLEDVRYVDNGRVICSAGVSAGIDMSYYVLSKLHGLEMALETARYTQYDYWVG